MEDSPCSPASRRRPLVVPAVCFASAVAFSRLGWQWSLALPAAAALSPFLLRGRYAPYLPGALCSAFAFAAGFAVALPRAGEPFIDALVSRGELPVRLQASIGEIEILPDRRVPGGEKESVFTAAVRCIEKDGQWEQRGGRIRVKVSGGGIDSGPGDLVRLTGILKPLTGAGNPGQFDFAGRLESSGIDALMDVPSVEMVEMIGKGFPSPLAVMWKARKALARVIDDGFPEREAALMRAMLLGDQAAMTRETRDRFVRSGTVHLLAVSGLHLMLVVSGLFFLLRSAGVSGRPASLAMIMAVWIFAGVTGLRVPVLRAAVMTTSYFAADLLGRERDAWNALALSLFLILGFRPQEISNPGFQLSFAAVTGIMTFSGPISRALLREERDVLLLSKMESDRRRACVSVFVGMSAAVSAAAWISTAPLSLLHFNLVAPVVPAANLIAAPLTALLLAAGFSSLPFLCLLPCRIFSFPASVTAWLLEETAAFFSSLPFSSFYLPAPDGWRIAAAYSLMILISLKGRLGRLGRAIPWPILAAGAALAVFYPAPQDRPEGLELVMLDVGQGSSLAAVFADGRVLLCDAGSHGNFPVGCAVIAPFLWSRKIRKIDLLVLSHSDSDHVNAVEDLADRFAIEAAAVPAGFSCVRDGRRTLEVLESRGVRVHFLHRGMIAPDGWADNLEILHPGGNPREMRHLSINNSSLALRLRYAGRTVLLPGDLEDTGLEMLLSSLDSPRFDAVVAPHHGSNDVAGNEPFAAAGPRALLVSCGRSFAADRTMDLYRKAGSLVYGTPEKGAVFVKISPSGAISFGSMR